MSIVSQQILEPSVDYLTLNALSSWNRVNEGLKWGICFMGTIRKKECVYSFFSADFRAVCRLLNPKRPLLRETRELRVKVGYLL